jgi:hypothetical protein
MLIKGSGGENSPNVHHVVPARDRRGLKCPCGKNSVKNAVVISAQLNRYFLNYDRTGFLSDCDSGMTEIEKVNSLPKYDPSLVAKVVNFKKKSKGRTARKFRGQRKR